MKKYFDILRRCSLLEAIEEDKYEVILNCLGAMIKQYKKNETIIERGDKAEYVGIVLSGQIQTVQLDLYGNRSIMKTIGETEVFGESFACAEVEKMPISVIAASDCEIMFIRIKRIQNACTNACGFHNQMIRNLLHDVAKSNFEMYQKMEIIGKRSTREKLMAYLMMSATRYNSATFTIPYDRQELADYLEVDRSGLSSEISKLRKEGVLECHKSTFTLLMV